MDNSLSFIQLHAASIAPSQAHTAKQYLTSFLNYSKQLANRVYQLVLNVFAQIAQAAGQVKDKSADLLQRGLVATRNFFLIPKIHALEAQLQAKKAEVQQLKANAEHAPAALPAAPQAIPLQNPLQIPVVAAPLPNDADYAQAQLNLADAQDVIARLRVEVHQAGHERNQQQLNHLADIARLTQQIQGLQAINQNLQVQVQNLGQAQAQNNLVNPAYVSGGSGRP